MLHTNRVWKIERVTDGEELAHMLTESTWCSCNGFEHRGFYFLNDSTSPDGAQEYAVVRANDGLQTESVTFGWMNATRAAELIPELVQPDAEAMFRFIVPATQLQTAEEHGTCPLCA
jgi:hypothetical protein